MTTHYHELPSQKPLLAKVVFLDIDGVMNPLSLDYYKEDHPGDRVMSNVCVGILNNICKKTGALIVTNTSHNVDHPGQPTIREALIANGVKEEYFHKKSKTEYWVTSQNRMKAIQAWMKDEKIDKWIAFDDEHFTYEENLILIDRDVGLTLKDMWKAMEYFGVKRQFTDI